ncbi:MAG: single-stranded DNA-binding protein [Ruminococcus sp.]
MLNRIILMGRLVADPELKTTAGGISVTSFRIAVERNYVNAEKERKTDFFDIVCWRNSAEFVCRYFSKGSLIALEGKLQSRTYQSKDGTNRYITEVVADTVSFTGERRDKQNNTAPPAAATIPEPVITPAPLPTSYTNPEELPSDDDLPF